MQRRSVNLLAILAGLLSLKVVMVTSWSWEESWFYSHRDPYHIDDYTHHSCKRECTADGQPKVCHYYFLLEHFTTMSEACHGCPDNQTDCTLAQCVTGDGFPRGILTANRRMPGPTVDVCEGDKIEVLIDNRMELGEGTSIHWHGLMQLGSPHMDGTSLVTQCPLHTWGKMVYRFTAKDVGTHFWHSHSSIQRSDGLFGGLIIRTPHSRDPQGPLYDHDLPEHNILLSDWSHQGAGEAYAQDFHSGKRAVVDSILVNGIGHYEDGPRLPYPEFQVKPGQRYRFRIAYNGIFNCPIYIKFDNHTMVVIASDGQNVEPLEVDALMIFSGERYDFVVQAKQDVKDNFWIRFKGHGRCSGSHIFQAAILRYEGAEKVDPPGVANYRNTEEDENERILNGRSGLSTNTTFQVVDLKSLGPDHIVDKDILTGKPDKQFYISLGASKVVDERFELPPLPNHTTLEPPTVRPFNHQLNYISSRLPPSPPLSQYYDIPKDLMCNNDTVKEDCSQVFCLCVHMLNFELGDLVEIVLVSFSRTLIHPMHMHGHAFRVISQKSYDHDLTVKEVKEMDKRGEIPRVTSQAPYKDTIGVHDRGVTILRFRAYNPGFWFFHCHIEFHTELGMALILQSGKPEDMPKAPIDFPTCGSWKPQHTTNKMEERNVTLHNTTNQKDSGSNPAPAGMMQEGFLTSAMIISFSIVAVVVVAALSVYGYVKRKQGQKSVFYERLVNMDPQTYRSI